MRSRRRFSFSSTSRNFSANSVVSRSFGPSSSTVLAAPSLVGSCIQFRSETSVPTAAPEAALSRETDCFKIRDCNRASFAANRGLRSRRRTVLSETPAAVAASTCDFPADKAASKSASRCFRVSSNGRFPVKCGQNWSKLVKTGQLRSAMSL